MNRTEMLQPKKTEPPIKFRVGDRVKPDNRKMAWESKKRGEVIEFGTAHDSMSWVRWDDRGSIVCWDNALLMYE